MSLSITNVYNYKGTHTIPFDQLPTGIISITGKSKIIDAILLALYGCMPAEVRYVVAHGTTTSNTSITISLNRDTYIINRNFQIGKKNTSEYQSFTKNEIDIKATNKPNNDAGIERLFGKKEDLCNTHISLQGRPWLHTLLP